MSSQAVVNAISHLKETARGRCALQALEAAEYGILQVSEDERWLDLLVKRGEDLVYICTWPNA